MNRKWKIFLRIFTTLYCVFVIVWIFSHSLQTGEVSSAQSSSVVEIVQTAAQKIAPNSWVATANGESYDLLHFIIRKLAHWSEFALFGFSLALCYAMWTEQKKFLFIPVALLILVPIADECLQLFVEARGAQIRDVCIDCFGGICGFALSTAVLWITYRISKKKGGSYGKRKS